MNRQRQQQRRRRHFNPTVLLVFLIAVIICHSSNALDNNTDNDSNNNTVSVGTEETLVDTTTLPPQQAQQTTSTDPCSRATTCVECQTAAQLMSSMPGKTCLWEVLPVEPSESDPKSNKDNNNSNLHACQIKTGEHQVDMCAMLADGIDKNGFQGGLLLLVALVAGLAYGRCKIMGAGSSFASVTSAASDLGSILNHSSKGKTTKRSETVPLANATTDDDEEWGWEDSSAGAAEIELGITSSSRGNDDEDLNKALAMEKKPRIPKFAVPPTKKTSGISVAAAPLQMPMQITSLGNKPPTRTVQKPNKPRTNDDLFASMGLASKPTFAKQVPVTASSAAVVATSSWKNPASPEPSADERWDDDGDLDDLLKD